MPIQAREISVVIPCFNEERTIYRNIHKIHTYLDRNFANFEIIAVNDGSTDNTLSELLLIQRKIPIEIINNEHNAGKGETIRRGIMESTKNVTMFLDADLAIPIEELGKFMRFIESGADIVIASRFVPGLKILKPVIWYRKIMEKIFQLSRMLILNSWKIKDTQCGFKVFKTPVAKRIFSMTTIKRFALDAEVLFIAKKLGYSIQELPVSLQNPAASSVRLLFDPLNMLFALLKIRLNDLRNQYSQKDSFFKEKIIILTADDFGRSPEANANILALARLGKLDRVSVLINEYLPSADIQSLLQSEAKIDIHLSLPAGIKINRLVYGESSIKRSLLFAIKYLSGEVSIAKMEKEWEAQIEKFITVFGKKPDGINSHQHIHFFPPYFKIVLALAKKYNVRHVRLGVVQLLKGHTNVFRILSFFQKKNKRLPDIQKINSSDYLISLDWIANFEKFLTNLPTSQTEIICHPERQEDFRFLKNFTKPATNHRP